MQINNGRPLVQTNLHSNRAPKKEEKPLLQHRGPDWSGFKTVDNHFLAHERLSILDVGSHGDQPMESKCRFHGDQGRVICIANCEIYNFEQLYMEKLHKDHIRCSNSDAEILLHMYEEYGDSMPQYLDGDFAFVIYDSRIGHFLVARDQVGVMSLYQGWSDDGSIWISSEMKAMYGRCSKIIHFPPGCLFSSSDMSMKRWYEPLWHDEEYFPMQKANLKIIKDLFEQAVEKRMMSDVPYGALLSGGLDSSLVAAIMARKLKAAGSSTVHTFSIGLSDSSDLEAARKVARHLGTIHHELQFTIDDGINSLENVIYHLETYDLAMVRAGILSYLLARRIKALGFKMVLSGEGADEIFGGYLFMDYAPDDETFGRFCVWMVKSLHYLNCLRVNKGSAAWGLEVRVPFLDKDFMDMIMNLHPGEKLHVSQGGRIEKYILRKAFDQPHDPYLPEEILWRQKEQFDDGVGYSWTDAMRSYAASQVSDEEMAIADATYPTNTPETKEAYLYRRTFEGLFGRDEACKRVIQCYKPRSDWGCNKDTCGRLNKIHKIHSL
uniref:Asparagine synthetase [glutamine-hydrolyzing] n=1 Tax=Romanomermis culicivorax TaxID=13658 RepID=A0A915HV04_ROMCU